MATNYANSYTAGASTTQFLQADTSSSALKTSGATSESMLTRYTTSKSWKQWASDKLNDIKNLGPDWDSYGGNPPSPRAVDIASILLDEVDKTLGRLDYEQSQPQIISPRADGGIQIEWGTSLTEIAVHTDPSGSIGYLYIGQQGDISTYEEVSVASWDETLRRIAKVVFTVPK